MQSCLRDIFYRIFALGRIMENLKKVMDVAGLHPQFFFLGRGLHFKEEKYAAKFFDTVGVLYTHFSKNIIAGIK